MYGNAANKPYSDLRETGVYEKESLQFSIRVENLCKKWL